MQRLIHKENYFNTPHPPLRADLSHKGRGYLNERGEIFNSCEWIKNL